MILVTGATGLVGAHLLLELTNNNTDSIRAIYRNENHILKTKKWFASKGKKSAFERIEWFLSDIRDIYTLEKAFVGITKVFHCAALISFDPDDEKEMRKINIEGTANVVNCCLSANVEKLCYISSIAALGDCKPNETVIDENSDWNPETEHSDYAISKYGAELEVWRGQQEGLEVVILNPGVILGGGFWEQGSGKIFSKINEGVSFFTNGVTGYVSAKDVAKIAFLTMENPEIRNEKYIVVAEHLTYFQLISGVCKSLNKNAPKVLAKSWMLELAWRMDWLFSKVLLRKRQLDKFGAKSLQTVSTYDNSKLIKTLGFEYENIMNCLDEIGHEFLSFDRSTND